MGEVIEFVDPADHSVSNFTFRAARRSSNIAVIAASAEGESVHGLIYNFSEGGLCIELKQQLESPCIFITLPPAGGRGSLTIETRVVHRSENRYGLAFKFHSASEANFLGECLRLSKHEKGRDLKDGAEQ